MAYVPDQITAEEMAKRLHLSERTIHRILKKIGVKPSKIEKRIRYYWEHVILEINTDNVKSRKRKPAENPTHQNHVLPDKTDAKNPCFASCTCAQEPIAEMANEIHVLRTELEQCKKVIKLIVAKIQKS